MSGSGRQPRVLQPGDVVVAPQRDAHLELIRARIGDRLRHDPSWGYPT